VTVIAQQNCAPPSMLALKVSSQGWMSNIPTFIRLIHCRNK